jgi:hypothetical protein
MYTVALNGHSHEAESIAYCANNNLDSITFKLIFRYDGDFME